MSDILLIYESEDKPRVKIIAEALELHGYSVCWDRKTPPGKTFEQVIEEELDAAKCVIVLWSQQSVLSDWVKEEVNEGFQRRILVPILIDDVRIPLGFRRIQAARLVNWRGKLPDPEFDMLLKSVRQILGQLPVKRMVGIENTLELSESAVKVKKPEVADAERERQRAFLEQLRGRKLIKAKAAAKPIKAKAKSSLKKWKRMKRAREMEKKSIKEEPKLQYYPGNTSAPKNRRKLMSNNLEKIRDISDDHLNAILDHRPDADYPSTHPPLSEMIEPDAAMREVVEPTPSAAIDDSTINRFPDVSMRDKVILDRQCTLRVAVTRHPIKEEFEKYPLRFKVPPGVESITVYVLVTIEDFEIIGDDYRPLLVPIEEDSEPILFKMIPRLTGEKKVKVDFFQNDRYIGGVTVKTTVVKPDETREPGEKSSAMQVNPQGIIELETRTPSPAPDLTMLITESLPDTQKGYKYKFKLHSPANGLFYHTVHEDLEFPFSPSKWMEKLYHELGNLGINPKPTDVASKLTSIGSDLFEKLFPRELKELWRQHIIGKVRSIMIISDEPWIPWEIIKPSYEVEPDKYKEDKFLCEGYFLSRWISGPPPPSLIKISRGALVAPQSNLSDVEREAKFMMSLGNVERVESYLDNILKLLREGGFHLIHFACHGEFDPDEHENSTIYLQDDKLMPRDISGERRNFGKDRPFVFLNACKTARADFSLVGIGSWADKFVSAKSSGFLGSSWEVKDNLAFSFSETFYNALRGNKTIGEAMKEARLQISQEPDPTWLAYTLYADPLAKVIFI